MDAIVPETANGDVSRERGLEPPSPSGRGPARRNLCLFAAVAFLLFIRLGASPLWTHEGRSAAICLEMARSGDYFHPRLFGEPYQDKPPLMYWLMIGSGRLLGGLSDMAMRLPSALAGLLAIACTIHLGRLLVGREGGFWAGWILASSVFFIFWARIAGPDMLNLAGTIAAVTWYFDRRDRPGFMSYLVFFLILAVTCLAKGLIGAAIPALVLIPDLLARPRWRAHLRPSLFLAALPAAAIYLLPFLLSALFGGDGGGGSGLALVFRENIVRFFAPFDHRADPFYAYGKFFPMYFLPWTLVLPFAIWRVLRHRKSMTPEARWPSWAVLLVFVFLSASLSRRSYYILPILPFAALMVGEWVAAGGVGRNPRRAWAWGIGGASAVVMAAWFAGIQPWASSASTIRALGAEVRGEAERRAPWAKWDVVLWDVPQRAYFYICPRARAFRFESNQAREVEAHVREHPRTIVVAPAEMMEQARRFTPRPLVFREPESPPAWWMKYSANPGGRKALVAVLPD
jgi:4-amino-4-deoxy-L-arabinose transferase-like glycosyltransferase